VLSSERADRYSSSLPIEMLSFNEGEPKGCYTCHQDEKAACVIKADDGPLRSRLDVMDRNVTLGYASPRVKHFALIYSYTREPVGILTIKKSNAML
jgi:hypothetical protein